MIWRNWLCALIGMWFVGHEWVFRGTPNLMAALWASVIVGAIQVIVSVWATAVREPNWQTWQNWLSFTCGLYFVAAEPFMEHYELGTYWGVVIPAIVTMALNFWSMMAGRPTSQVGTRV